ncbi:hypothetical protein [Psychromonas sp. MME1]|uniref:hypothetical protein n=1 Tax=Psychromonas sp. MME1 TaxID=3231032 RepID=UPI0034E1D29B
MPRFVENNVLLVTLLICVAIVIVTYLLHQYLQDEQPSSFDFYKVNSKIDQPNIFESDMLSTSKPMMDTPFLIDEDGLDPSIVFNVEKTGADILILLENIKQENHFSDYLTARDISVKLIGSPIEGVNLIEMQYQGLQGYYRVTNNDLYSSDDVTCNIDVAFLHDTDVLRLQVEKALLDMFNDCRPNKVVKYNARNYQAMFKFYTYVQKLARPENQELTIYVFIKVHLKLVILPMLSYIIVI